MFDTLSSLDESATVVIGAILVTLVGWQASAQDAVIAEFFAAEDVRERTVVPVFTTSR